MSERQQTSEKKYGDAIPAADSGSHSKSEAAHPGAHLHEHTKPAGDLKHGLTPAAQHTPPRNMPRTGK